MLVLVTAVTVAVLPWLLEKPVPPEFVIGSCSKDFAKVEQVYR